MNAKIRKLEMEIIKAYKSTSGQIFLNEEDCLRADAETTFLNYYRSNPLRPNQDTLTDEANSVVEWLKRNRIQVLNLLNPVLRSIA